MVYIQACLNSLLGDVKSLQIIPIPRVPEKAGPKDADKFGAM